MLQARLYRYLLSQLCDNYCHFIEMILTEVLKIKLINYFGNKNLVDILQTDNEMHAIDFIEISI